MTFILVNHGWIAFLYYALAALTAGAFYVRGVSSLKNTVARVGGVAFFVGCGLSHVEMIAHGGSDPTPMDYFAAHHLIPTLMQSVGAAVFITIVLSAGARGFYFARQRDIAQ